MADWHLGGLTPYPLADSGSFPGLFSVSIVVDFSYERQPCSSCVISTFSIHLLLPLMTLMACPKDLQASSRLLEEVTSTIDYCRGYRGTHCLIPAQERQYDIMLWHVMTCYDMSRLCSDVRCVLYFILYRGTYCTYTFIAWLGDNGARQCVL